MLHRKWTAPGQLNQLALAISVCLATTAQAEEARQLPEMTVEGESIASPAVFPVDLAQTPVTTADTASLLERAPGANVNRNGPLTGIAQYRGMYADQINVLVNGIHINTGGPNGMDPALSYAPRAQLESLEIIRGIAPVSSGLETIGGTMKANVKTSHFATGDTFSPSVDVTFGGATVDESYSVSGFGAAANQNHRLHAYGSKEKGNDYEIPDGKVRPSEYDRKNYGAGYGFQSNGHEVGFNVRHNRTDETGTPSLPMDIDYIDTDILESEYKGKFGAYDVHGQLFYTDVEHKMNNYDLRMAMPAMTRQTKATSDGLGYRADVGFEMASGRLLLGTDGQFDSHDATVTDPINDSSIRVEGYNNVDRDAFGAFAEWEGAVASDWNMQLGGRYTRVESSSGNVSHSMAGMNPAIALLQNRFNSANKDNNQNNYDVVAKLAHTWSSQLGFNVEGGIKNRAPSYQQLYLWAPMQSTNGMADGHNYVGDLDLDSETAYEAGLGLDWNSPRLYASPRVFYRYVKDYIQGTPATDPTVIMISTMMGGDPNPLQWSNVDAKLYGFDMDWGATLSRNWSLDGVVSYVRGKRDDINDNLYRIAPLNGSATLTYRQANWWAGLEGVTYARQNNPSETNSETKSDDYTLANLRGGIQVKRNFDITVGVENIFDENYQPHLAGINRVAASDVPVDERLNGPGRNYFATLTYRYE